MRKKLLFLSTMLVLTLSLSACAKSTEPEQDKVIQNTAGNEEQTKDKQEESKKEVTYPVTVTDQIGREVVIKEEPKTVVSGYYISTSLLLALGEKDHLAGIEAKAATRSIYKLAAPEIIDLPSVGTAKEFDLEGCAALNPDLVILPAKLKDVIPSLEQLGITVLAVKPEDQTLLEEAVTLLGTATNSMEKAEALLTNTDTKMAELKKALEGVEKPKVYMAGNSSFLSTAGEKMYQNTLIVNAGGQNVAQELTDTYWAEVDYEQILAWNPDYIILAADADYTVESVLADENLAECTAVVKKQVYQFPNDIEAWDSPVPASVLGNLWLASVLHPEKYPADKYEKAVADFYSDFYNFTVTN